MADPTDEDKRLKKRTTRQQQNYWRKEIDASQKRCKKFNTSGDQVVQRFNNKKILTEQRGVDNEPFVLNLFNANITTLKAMLCGNLPKVEVHREFADPDDDAARVAANMLQRMLQQNIEASPINFTDTLKSVLEDRLLPGMGTARVRYTNSTQTLADGTQVPYQNALTDYVHWKDMLWSYARVWEEVWWIAYRSYLTKEQVDKRFPGKSAGMAFESYGPTGADRDGAESPDEKDSELKAEVWEIWDKSKRKVFWYHSSSDVILDEKDDPLRLDNFFPSPKPMFANLTTSEVMPTADFDIAKKLYEEIDELQTRIGIITEAVRVVGVYDGSNESIARMLDEGYENQLIPASNWAMFAEKGGLNGAVDWFPVKDVAEVLVQLISVRDQTIALLYQVTGMADILRGQSEQYAGVGQEQIKEKYASIRVQSLQDDFARFASELQTLKAEVIAKHFREGSIAQQSNAMFMLQADHPYIEHALMLIKSPGLFWRVEIRPESIAMVDYAQMQSERTQYLTATATYLQSSQAMIKALPAATPALIALLKWGLAGFRGANEIEGVLDQALDAAQQAVNNGELGGQQDNQADMMKEQMAMQREQQKHQFTMEQQQQKHMNAMEQLVTKAQGQMALERQQFQNSMQSMLTDFRQEMQKIAANLNADLQVEQSQAGHDMLEQDNEHEQNIIEGQFEHENDMDEEAQKHSNKMEQIRAQRAGSEA